MEQNVFMIKIKIKTESDLYHPFDEDQKTLSEDVISYIERKYEEKHLGDKPVIRIICDEEIDEHAVREAFHSHVESEKESIRKEAKINTLKQLRLFAIGIAFIALWLTLSANIENILIEVLSIVGSFSIWEATNIWIVDKPELRVRKKRLEYLSGTKIVFNA